MIDDDLLQEATLCDDRTVSSAFLCIDCCNVVTEIGAIFLFLKMRLVAGVQDFVLEKMYRLQLEVAVTYRSGEETAKCRSCFDANAVRLIRDAVWVRMSMQELLLKLDFLNGVDDVAYGCLQE